MKIDELRANLEDKAARGVKQVRVTTMLESLPSSPAEAFPDQQPQRPKRGRRGPRADETLDLVGTAEAAEILGVERPRIGKWRALGKMPEPVADLAAGPVWRRAEIDAMWSATEARRRGPRRLNAAPAG